MITLGCFFSKGLVSSEPMVLIKGLVSSEPMVLIEFIFFRFSFNFPYFFILKIINVNLLKPSKIQ